MSVHSKTSDSTLSVAVMSLVYSLYEVTGWNGKQFSLSDFIYHPTDSFSKSDHDGFPPAYSPPASASLNTKSHLPVHQLFDQKIGSVLQVVVGHRIPSQDGGGTLYVGCFLVPHIWVSALISDTISPSQCQTYSTFIPFLGLGPRVLMGPVKYDQVFQAKPSLQKQMTEWKKAFNSSSYKPHCEPPLLPSAKMAPKRPPWKILIYLMTEGLQLIFFQFHAKALQRRAWFLISHWSVRCWRTNALLSLPLPPTTLLLCWGASEDRRKGWASGDPCWYTGGCAIWSICFVT